MTHSGFKTAQKRRNNNKKHTSHVNRSNLNKFDGDGLLPYTDLHHDFGSWAIPKNTKKSLTSKRNIQLEYKITNLLV